VPIGHDDESGQEMLPIADSRKTPDEAYQAFELRQVVSRVISELPEKYREVFVLSAIRNLRYEEIAEIVGRSLGSVKTDIHRARLQVREKVKGYLRGIES
jgi:RNA polymerase sigma-70 factor (ECF subfamily)